jgi:3'(2'), 5'-bisphosphate nucleotidase
MASPSDHTLAARIATGAGELLVETRYNLARLSVDRWTLQDEGDRRAHDFIVAALHEARPDDAVLSEEGKDDPSRLSAERVWIVDPLDGTREFSEGRHDWAVHVALTEGGRPTAGAVALPALSRTFTTSPPESLPERNGGRPRMVVSRSRPPAAAMIIAEAIGAELVALGSAGAKTMSILLGESDIYAHSGGQYEWDNCAPGAVAAAAGLHVSRADGSEMTYNHADPWLPDLLICRPEYAEQSLAAIRTYLDLEP